MRGRGTTLAMLLTVLVSLNAASQDRDSALAESRTMLNRGDYEGVRQSLSSELSNPDTAGVTITTYLSSFLHAGEYEAGIREAARLMDRYSDDPFVRRMFARLLERTGKYDLALNEYRQAGRLRRNFWENAMDYAELLRATGNDPEAMQISSTIVSAYKQGYFTTAPTLTTAGRAAVLIGEFHDANNAFRTAFQVDPSDVDNLFYWAEVFRTKYNEADARRTFSDAIKLNDNRSDLYSGLALSTPGFAAKEQLAQEALSRNPRDVRAITILASMAILDGDNHRAATLLEDAMEVNANDLSVLAHLTALDEVSGDSAGAASWEQQALAVNPRPVDYYATVAEILPLQFRYDEALTYSRKAFEADPSSPTALASLGAGLLRLGRADEAHRYLERAFGRDQFNLFVSNMLTLVEEYDTFVQMSSENFELLIHHSEQDVLGERILEEAERAYAALSERYPYRPGARMVIEAYHDADDFAVRIAGIPHLGLLGVAFGDVVAINTPKAQGRREYNWARTLWHEIAHTMAIGVSNHRVPRWFTEGLSVYEEHQAFPEWRREMDLELFSALDQDRLHGISDMGRGFTRPEFPGQVLLSYYHASKIVEYLAEQFSFASVITVLTELRDGETMEQALETASGLDAASLDREIMVSLQDQKRNHDRVLAGMPDLLGDDGSPTLSDPTVGGDNRFLQRLRDGNAALTAGNHNRAEDAFRQAIELYPEYVGAGNAYSGLADIYRVRNDEAMLVDILEQYLKISDYGVEEARELASIYEERGEINKAAVMVEKSFNVDPYAIEWHGRLASMYASLQQFDDAVRERKAILALDPVDRARAYYDLAEAYYADHDVPRAKRAVLQSLELAPGFGEAQRLLLLCVDGEGEVQ